MTMSGNFAEQEPTASPIPLPIVSPSVSTSPPQAPTTISSERHFVLNPSGETLASTETSISEPNLLPIPYLNNAEHFNIFTDYLSHDMRCDDEASRNFGAPFMWMTSSIDGPFRSADTSDQVASNLCMLSDGNLATAEITESTDSTVHGLDSCANLYSGEARASEDLARLHACPQDVCPSFPMLQEDELQRSGAEIFGYVSNIPRNAYAALRSFYVSELGYDDTSFPQSGLLHAFVELYFEYFDPHLPFLHPMRVETDQLSWVLLTAVAAIGSQYSEVRDASKFTVVLQSLLRRATHHSVCLHSLVDVHVAYEVGLPRFGKGAGYINSTERTPTRYRTHFLRLNNGSKSRRTGEKYTHSIVSRSDDVRQLRCGSRIYSQSRCRAWMVVLVGGGGSCPTNVLRIW